ncbi:MAG: FAD-binding oxidoreductase [Bryobacteraceae bacterium]
MKAKLLSYRDVAPATRHFEFELRGLDELRFKPGQFVSVKHIFDGREITRAYSITSKPGGNQFALCLNRIENGLVSKYLFELEPGAEIEIDEALGYFTLRNPQRDALFVATGTGVAPFRSMLLQHLPEVESQITLLMGCRYPHGLMYREELNELAQTYAHFSFVPTVTRPDESWRGRTGRVQAHLDEVLDERRDIDVYICGLKEMVDDVRSLLKQKGFDRRQIIYEKYD